MSAKPPTRDEIGERLARLANHLMDRILDGDGEEELAIEQETSAFKAITNYYAMLKKLEPPNRDESAFNGWQNKIPGTSRGGSNSRDHVSESSETATDEIEF